MYRDWGVVRKADRDDNFNRAGEDLAAYKSVEPGDLVVNKMKTWQGSLGVSPYRGIVSPAYFVCQLSESVDGRFIHHLLRSQPYIAMYRANSKGIRPNQWDLPYDFLRQMPVLTPPLDEQQRIANFLDDRVAEIDQTIASRREQIRLLTDCYSAWLDGLVAQYDQVPMRRFLTRIEQGWSPVADSVPAGIGESGVLKLGAIRAGTFDSSQNKAFLPASTPREEYRIRKGDLLITRANTPALVGDVAVATDIGNIPLYLSDLIYRADLSNYDEQLASASLRTSKVRQLVGVLARGTSGSMPKLRGEDLAELPLPNVPAADRAQLGALDVTERIATGRKVASLERSVDLLAEYKSSLITAAVNGRIDVTTSSSEIPR